MEPVVATANGIQLSRADLDAFVARQMDELDMPGLSLAVIGDGEIVYHRATGVADRSTGVPVTEESIFEAASLSKPVFAYLVLRLADRGVIDIDRPLHEYLPMPELADDPRYRTVTARMALSHRSGFPNWRWFDPAPEDWDIPRGTMYMKTDPGTFTYSGEGYTYLSQVVAHLMGYDMTTLDQLFRAEVAEPLGMTHASYIRTPYVASHKVTGHKDGEPFEKEWPRSFPDDTPLTFGAAGRLHTDALEYARFLVALIEGRGLSPEMRAAMFTAITDVPAESDTRRLTGETGWTLGLAVEPTPYGLRFEHGGNNGDFQSGFMIFPEQGLGYVFMTNSDRGEAFNGEIERFLTEGR